MRASAVLPRILLVLTLLLLLPGALRASPEEGAGDEGPADATRRLEEAQRRLAKASDEVRALRQWLRDAQHAASEIAARADAAARHAAEVTAHRERLVEAYQRLRAQETTLSTLASEAPDDAPGEAREATLQRLTAALGRLHAQNRQLEARVAALERERQQRQAHRAARRGTREQRGEPRGTPGLEARLARMEAKLDALLRAAQGRENAPMRRASRLNSGAASPPPAPTDRRPPSAPSPSKAGARLPHPGAGATMMEIEQLLRRARTRIRDLERTAASRDR